MDLDDIKKIMDALQKSELKKMIIKQDDFELHLEKESVSPVTTVLAEPQVAAPAVPNITVKTENEQKPLQTESKLSINSPMVGTFYSSPAPDQPSFVKVGDKVSEDTVVCIIEAMKVMNEVKAGVSGTVAEVLIENGQPVEFGTSLFQIA